MGQNRYDRSYDNDRAPEPKKSFGSRLKIRASELLEDLIAPFRKAEKRRRAHAEARRAEREEEREERERAALDAEADQASEESEIVGGAGYGKDDFTQMNHIAGDGAMMPQEGSSVKRRRIECTSRVWLYLALLVGAFIFTQALHAKASNIFFGFVVFLPLVLLLYTLTALYSLQMNMASDGATVRKREPYTYEMRLLNQSPFAYPFIEAVMILPQSNSVRCRERSVYLSMAPFGTYEIRSEVRFRFRGSYRIGVECFYVYDFFRLFRVRVDIENSVTVRVLPRRMPIGEEGVRGVSDEPEPSNNRSATIDRVEVGDIRTYLPGDPLKLIHWNLTLRLEEPVVKDYVGGRTKITYVYCDLAARFPEDPPVLPELSKKERKRMAREEREKKNAKKRKARAIARAEKHGDPLREEELAALDLTRAERKSEKRAKKDARKQKRQLLRLAELQKTDPKKAALMRDRLRYAERLAAERREQEASEQDGGGDFKETLEEEALLLRDASCYEDMNEYCADGIVDLALASAYRELQRGNETVLIWQDVRSLSGLCAYSFRSVDELQTVYPLFAAAPLVKPDGPLVRLSSFAGDTSGVKQIFVTAAIDKETVSAFCNMPSFGGAGSGSELILYSPEERFLYPDRRRAYIEGCRAELLASGIVLSVEKPAADCEEGGDPHVKA